MKSPIRVYEDGALMSFQSYNRRASLGIEREIYRCFEQGNISMVRRVIHQESSCDLTGTTNCVVHDSQTETYDCRRIN